MRKEKYDRKVTKEYAKRWAYSRNPKYYNFDNLGGDCTNFVSQCIYQGAGIMNYTKDFGWYYNSLNDRSPSWSGVEFLSEFLINNKGVGPRGKIANMDEVDTGDVVQLSFDGINFSHTLIIVNIIDKPALDDIYIACHTYDSYNRRISTYNFEKIRFIHIENVYKW